MMYRLTIALLVVSIAFVHHAQGTTTQVECRNNTECAAGQCCYIEPEFLVVSRRDSKMPAMDLPIPPHHVKHDTGRCEYYHIRGEHCNGLVRRCEYYHRRGEHCDGIEVMNGHCGCAAGLSCQWVPEPTTTAATRGRRGPPFHLRPGSYQCS